MAAIHKIKLALESEQVVLLPTDARILGTSDQADNPRMWALYEDGTDAPIEPVTIRMFAPGEPFPEDVELEYLGLVKIGDGYTTRFYFKVL